MNWRNVKLIYLREMRDQLRDRRTLFMITVLPLLLYPFLGMSVFQLSQFMRKHQARIVVIGAQRLEQAANVPPLFEDGEFAPAIGIDSDSNSRIELDIRALDGDSPEAQLAEASKTLAAGETEVVLYFPADFATKLDALSQEVRNRREGEGDPLELATLEVPQPEIVFDSTKEQSRGTQLLIERVLSQWRSLVVRRNLIDSRVPLNIAKPFAVKPHDVAAPEQRDAVLWSKLLPFVLFIWALTGAFYPAVDLCAGEKERGTLETLLSSPALRTEIVWGKLLTVITFSMTTALLNLASMGMTAQYVISQLRLVIDATGGEGGLAFPPWSSIVWLVIALVPVSALFSALCLACAAFARSTKEGQYYLMPLLLTIMPLMLLPMSPGIDLNLGNSLIPVTGLVLLLRSLIEGRYLEVLPYIAPVAGVTSICCLLAIRWAVEQFQQESVLFRESERFDIRTWLVHLVRDRRDTPSLAEGVACFALILVIQFFVRLSISSHVPENPDLPYMVLVVFISQVVCIATPALLMTLILTGNPLRTLLLESRPRLSACVAAIFLAATLHPVGQLMAIGVQYLYPISDDVATSSQALIGVFADSPYPWLPFLLLAILPAICEECAFRGFILSGFRHLGHKWWAIGLSAIAFGMSHTILQQSILASLVGVVIGYVAIQSGSLLPCILFHMTYNGLMLYANDLTSVVGKWVEQVPVINLMLTEAAEGQFLYSYGFVATCGCLAIATLYWFSRLPWQQSKEEWLQTVRHQQAASCAS